MKLGDRNVGAVASALLQQRHWTAARNMLQTYQRPAEMFGRYLLKRGRYPAGIGIGRPTGPITLTAYSYDDMLTINEIFCRLDYPIGTQDQVVVDFGSNIGVSAAYFLSANPNAFVHLFEPLQLNIDRLRNNLRPFEGRYELHAVAVGETDGDVQFGWEDTGRYGGVGVETGQYVSVPCRDSNDVLGVILARHGRIDILKVDIETLERQVTERIPAAMARRIGRIYVEYPFDCNPLEQTHTYRQYGSVAQFSSKDAPALSEVRQAAYQTA